MLSSCYYLFPFWLRFAFRFLLLALWSGDPSSLSVRVLVCFCLRWGDLGFLLWSLVFSLIACAVVFGGSSAGCTVIFLTGVGSLSGSSSDSEEGSVDMDISAGPIWWMNLQVCPLLHLPFRKNLHVAWTLVCLTGRAFVYDAMACCSLSLSTTSLAMSFIIFWIFMAWLAGPLSRNLRLPSSVSMVLISILYNVLIFRMFLASSY